MTIMTTEKTKQYLDQLTSQGEISFTKQKMQKEMQITAKAAERATYYLRKRREICSPAPWVLSHPYS